MKVTIARIVVAIRSAKILTPTHIAVVAARAMGLRRGLPDYFAICACHTLRVAAFDDVPPVRRRHAVAHAAKLLGRLESSR